MMKSIPSRESKRILIIANPRSPLTQQRGGVGIQGGYRINWYPHQNKNRRKQQSLLHSGWNSFTRFSSLGSPWVLKTFIQRIQPDLIHVHYAYQGLDTLLLARFKPLMVTVMGGDILPDQGFHGFRKWMVKKLLDAADVITSKSQFLDETLNRIGPYADKIRRVTWGIDTKRFRPGLDVTFLRRKWNIQPEDLVFFCPRICHPFYNQHVIIEAFADHLHRAEAGHKAKLIFSELGADEAYRRRLRNLVDELKLTEHVRFVGVIPHSEMPLYFNLADTMVAIPPSDGIPQSLYEAMGCGTLPILGNLPQYQELIQDGVNGKLVRVGEIPALSEAMDWVAAHKEHRKATALLNRQHIMEVANKEVQDNLVNSIYDKLLEE